MKSNLKISHPALAKIQAENAAASTVETLFEQLKRKTGIALSVESNHCSAQHLVVLEAYGNAFYQKFPTKRFASHFSSYTDMATYFQSVLPA